MITPVVKRMKKKGWKISIPVDNLWIFTKKNWVCVVDWVNYSIRFARAD